MSPEVRQLLEDWAKLGLTWGIFNRLADLRVRTWEILEAEDQADES